MNNNPDYGVLSDSHLQSLWECCILHPNDFAYKYLFIDRLIELEEFEVSEQIKLSLATREFLFFSHFSMARWLPANGCARGMIGYLGSGSTFHFASCKSASLLGYLDLHNICESEMIQLLKVFRQLRISYLGLSGMKTSPRLLLQLFSEGVQSTLHSLKCQSWMLDGESISQLLNLLSESNITDLTLSFNPLRQSGVIALCNSCLSEKLTSLDLTSCDITDCGLIDLLSATHMTRLDNLRMSFNKVGSTTMRCLPHALHLSSIDLSFNCIQWRWLDNFASSLITHRLKELDLSNNPIGDEGVRILFESSVDLSVRYLDLGHIGMSESGLEHLCNSRCLHALEHLVLDGNVIRDFGVNLIRRSIFTRTLRSLSLSSTGITLDGLIELLNEDFEKIELIIVSCNNMSTSDSRLATYSNLFFNFTIWTFAEVMSESPCHSSP